MLARTPAIARGALLRVPNGTFVVMGFDGHDAAACPVLQIPDTRHRADVSLNWVDAMLLGVDSNSVVRGAPIVLRGARKYACVGAIGHDLMARINRAVNKEIQAREWEESQGWPRSPRRNDLEFLTSQKPHAK